MYNPSNKIPLRKQRETYYTYAVYTPPKQTNSRETTLSRTNRLYISDLETFRSRDDTSTNGPLANRHLNMLAGISHYHHSRTTTHSSKI